MKKPNNPNANRKHLVVRAGRSLSCRLRLAALILIIPVFSPAAQETQSLQEEKTAAPPRVWTPEENWTRALGGDALSPIQAFQDKVYVLGTDRCVTCMSEKGGFLWRKPVGFRPTPLFLVSKEGLICLFSRTGEIRVFSSNGMVLWHYKEKDSPPLLPPFEGKDGRLFLVYEDEMICLAANGLQKWRRNINGKNAAFMAEDGHGNIVVCAGSRVTVLSPWGDVLGEAHLEITPDSAAALDGTGCAFFVPVSGGHKITAVDLLTLLAQQHGGTTRSAVLWESAALARRSAALAFRGTLYYAGRDGTVTLFNATDGNALAAASLAPYAGKSGAFSGGSLTRSVRGGEERVVFTAEGICAAISTRGEILWAANFSRALKTPVFTRNGFAVSSPQNSVMRGFLAEFSLGGGNGGSAPEELPSGYGIFQGKSSGYGITYQPGLQPLFPYFEETRKKIRSGNLGNEEREISKRLAEILRNDTGNPFSDNRFADTERSQAAVMLGELGSDEARSILLDAARSEQNESVLSGILYGIAEMGPDSSGETFGIVSYIIRSSKNHSMIHRAAATALLSVVKTAPNETSVDAMKLLLNYTRAPYDGAIQKYAQQIVENLFK